MQCCGEYSDTVDCVKFHNAECHNLFSSPGYVMVIKSIRWDDIITTTFKRQGYEDQRIELASDHIQWHVLILMVLNLGSAAKGVSLVIMKNVCCKWRCYIEMLQVSSS